MNIENKKKLSKNWFLLLRDVVCFEIENLEKIYSKKNKKKLIACIYKSSKKVNNRLDFN